MHEDLMEEVVTPENAEAAWLAVKRNGGAPGIDGMTTTQLRDHVREHWETIGARLLAGTYVPSPVRRVEIPKPNGGGRLLGLPTVLDRWIQQMLLQKLQAIFDPTFHAHSYGFRPGKSAHDAVRAAQTSDELRDIWRAYVRGWWGYFRLAEERRNIFGLEGWIRRHIRACFWQRWDQWRGRLRKLRSLGLSGRLQKVAHSSKGAWPIAASPSLQTALSNAVLRRYGFWMPSDLASP